MMNYPDELIFLKNRSAKQRVSTVSLEKKVIVLSGATSGIGRVSAFRLAQDRAHLVLIGRNMAKLNALKEELISLYDTQVDTFMADYEDLASVKKAGIAIRNAFTKIDIVIHNAGIHSTQKIITNDGYELNFQINYLASYCLTQLLKPSLEKASPSLVLYINSEGHRFARFRSDDYNFKTHHYTGLRGYGSSKTAQLLSVLALKDEFKDRGITLMAMHPGDVKSNIGTNNGFLYRTFSRFFIQPMLRDPQSSAEAIHTLIADPFYKQVEDHFFHLTIAEIPAAHARDEMEAQKLIELSNQILKPYLG